jgi:ATP adenylyltransferase
MEIVYSPWRLQYVTDPDKQRGGCVFCRAFHEEPSLDNLVVYRDEATAILLNKFPYTNGHLLVVPRAHVDSLSGLTAQARAAAIEAVTCCEDVLRRTYHPHGFNVGLNLGEAAGAGILDHLHFHIVPRWTGDTNFTTLFGELRVIPEDLQGVFDRLRRAFPPRIG